MTGARHAFIVGVRPERREEYLTLHRNVWPQVEAALSDAHITNYSIHVLGNVLVGYWEYAGNDYAGDLAKLDNDPVSAEWLKLTDPCQVRIGEEVNPRAIWQPLSEIWHLD